ncbi:MAG: branched-chain amino acid ABC transporter permease [Rhodospirillum sp.]|nr:branched-chain amino acid ABC transporter permease [Rhodospirillum sp.]MCF8490565.1 branched-chain amino acid ABC transporter permease [Rhodospirillum sp.]MCF8502122.1 branched-chain amino acid ABC transporter permease [Rhodospirillum sp.]
MSTNEMSKTLGPDGGGGALVVGWKANRWWIAGLIVLAVAPFLVYPIFLAKILCFALFAIAFNLLLGYVGLLSFGHAAFFGMAAYISGHVMKEWGVTPEVAILIATASMAVLGVVFGMIAIRRQGIYFAMVTLALSQMVYFLALQSEFTHGEDGIQGIPRGAFLGLVSLESSLSIYYFVAGVFVLGFLFVYRVIHSPFGQVLKSVRENEARATSLGYDTDRYKLLAFTLSATLAGLAGATKVLVFQLASLTDVTWQMSGEVVLMTLLGGVGTILGPVVGAGIVVSMHNLLAEIGSVTTIVQGLIFILCVLVFRRGVVGEVSAWLRRRRSTKKHPRAG